MRFRNDELSFPTFPKRVDNRFHDPIRSVVVNLLEHLNLRDAQGEQVWPTRPSSHRRLRTRQLSQPPKNGR
jgi:hypothetical protein